MKIAMALCLPLLLLLWSGCAQSINWNDPIAIANHVQIEEDRFKKVTSFIGPNLAMESADRLLLRAWKLRSGSMAYQIYVEDEYIYEILRGGLGWRFYSTAYDSDGNPLPTQKISRTVNWCGRNVCSYLEILGIDITREYLEQRKDRGIIVKISGKNGEELLSIPSAYVQAFLSVSP